MGRKSKPWWWAARGAYFATIGGKHVNLGTNLKIAASRLKSLQEIPREHLASNRTVGDIFESFLVWTQQNREPRTFKGYKEFLDSFYAWNPNLQIGTISAADVTAWLNTKPGWGATRKYNAITCLKRCFNWAVRNDGLRSNPIQGMQKPQPHKRNETITTKEFMAILRHSKSKNFRKLLLFCWDCGCRPQEARAIQPRHVDLKHSRICFSAEEGKGKIPRDIYLVTRRAVAYVQAGMQQKYIFLNDRGQPWKMFAINSHFYRLSKEKELGVRYHIYTLRHTWITRKLKEGLDSHIVAKLAGHCNTQMIDRVYSHIADDPEFLLKQAQKKR